MRAIIVPRPNKAPRCVQKRPRISHAKVKTPFRLASRPPSASLTPWPVHPLASRIDDPRKRSHLNANNALIATRGRSHRIEAGFSLPYFSPGIPSSRSRIPARRARHIPSATPFYDTSSPPTVYDLCPRTTSFYSIIAPCRTSRAHPPHRAK